jgi:hypothetical protein
MHPIERLRHVARSSGAASATLVAETAVALRAFGRDPQGLVTACRRIVSRQPTAGPLWYLAARALTAADGLAESQRVAAEVADDPTDRELAHALPEGSTVVVVGWPDTTAAALSRRGDLRVRVVDSGGDGGALVDALVAADVDAFAVPDRGVGAAAEDADLIVVETTAAGPTGALVPHGSVAAAAVAHVNGVPVWLVGGVGRWLPERLFTAMVDRVVSDQPWMDDAELIGFDLIDEVVGPGGRGSVPEAVAAIDCPPAPELYRTL